MASRADAKIVDYRHRSSKRLRIASLKTMTVASSFPILLIQPSPEMPVMPPSTLAQGATGTGSQ